LAVHAQRSTDPRIADLIQSGRLRVALGLGSPELAMKDANTGEVRGPALDLARALAEKTVLSSNLSNTQGRAQYWRVLRTTNGT
jgi:ABC-type amino acid transport substrate-binding protein